MMGTEMFTAVRPPFASPIQKVFFVESKLKCIIQFFVSMRVMGSTFSLSVIQRFTLPS